MAVSWERVQALTHALSQVDATVDELGQHPGRWDSVAVLLDAADADELGSRYEVLGCEVKVEKELRAGDSDFDWVVQARK